MKDLINKIIDIVQAIDKFEWTRMFEACLFNSGRADKYMMLLDFIEDEDIDDENYQRIIEDDFITAEQLAWAIIVSKRACEKKAINPHEKPQDRTIDLNEYIQTLREYVSSETYSDYHPNKNSGSGSGSGNNIEDEKEDDEKEKKKKPKGNPFKKS